MREVNMDELNMDELKALVAEYVSAVNQGLESHRESLSRLTAAVERVQQNQAIEHVNVKEIGEMVNQHTAILAALDAEVKRRLNVSTEEPPPALN